MEKFKDLEHYKQMLNKENRYVYIIQAYADIL